MQRFFTTTGKQDNIATIRHATLIHTPPCVRSRECVHAIVVSHVQRGKGVDARAIVAGTRARSCCRLRSKSLAFSPAPAEACCDDIQRFAAFPVIQSTQRNAAAETIGTVAQPWQRVYSPSTLDNDGYSAVPASSAAAHHFGLPCEPANCSVDSHRASNDLSPRGACTHARTRTRTRRHTHTHAHARTRRRRHAQAQAHARARTHARTGTHSDTHAQQRAHAQTLNRTRSQPRS
jgi:hypothetical protein